MFSTIMTIINISSLILIAIVYFREHYTIVDLETWNEIAHSYNEHGGSESEQDGDVASCNVGFFCDYVSEVEEQEEEGE